MEPVAEGVWLVRGGVPALMNVYLIEDQGGVTMFDAGISAMTGQLGKAVAKFGGLKRIVLGHGHADHRGAARKLAKRTGAPVLAHEAEVADAEGDGGAHYFDKNKLEHGYARLLMNPMLKMWDGGPVKISDALAEGDTIAGFDVVHFPGHAPGMIGLWRERDGLALTTDVFYTLDPETARKGAARVPHAAFNMDTEMARASILKLAALEPKAAWPGHADPLLEDVVATLGAVGRGGDATGTGSDPGTQ
ncbi:MAG: MBL fold metallo-hydrolase [Actinobacteria bacterium]|nr:MBL fold metallo-hydrolase [Actinomycetota bacterium]